MERQSVLETKGWNIHGALRPSEFSQTRPRDLRPVFEKLQMLEIPPAGDAGRRGCEAGRSLGDRPLTPVPKKLAGIGRKPMSRRSVV